MEGERGGKGGWERGQGERKGEESGGERKGKDWQREWGEREREREHAPILSFTTWVTYQQLQPHLTTSLLSNRYTEADLKVVSTGAQN